MVVVSKGASKRRNVASNIVLWGGWGGVARNGRQTTLPGNARAETPRGLRETIRIQ